MISSRRGSWLVAATGSPGMLPRPRRSRFSKTASRRRRPRPRCDPNGPRATSGWRRTWARLPSRSACAQGLRYRGAIKDALLTVLKLASRRSSRESAGSRAGRLYYKVPGLFGGSDKKSEEANQCARSLDLRPLQRHRVALASSRKNAVPRASLHRHDAEARAELQRVLGRAARSWVGAGSNRKEFKAKARALLEGEEALANRQPPPRAFNRRARRSGEFSFLR